MEDLVVLTDSSEGERSHLQPPATSTPSRYPSPRTHQLTPTRPSSYVDLTVEEHEKGSKVQERSRSTDVLAPPKKISGEWTQRPWNLNDSVRPPTRDSWPKAQSDGNNGSPAICCQRYLSLLGPTPPFRPSPTSLDQLDPSATSPRSRVENLANLRPLSANSGQQLSGRLIQTPSKELPLQELAFEPIESALPLFPEASDTDASRPPNLIDTSPQNDRRPTSPAQNGQTSSAVTNMDSEDGSPLHDERILERVSEDGPARGQMPLSLSNFLMEMQAQKRKLHGDWEHRVQTLLSQSRLAYSRGTPDQTEEQHTPMNRSGSDNIHEPSIWTQSTSPFAGIRGNALKDQPSKSSSSSIGKLHQMNLKSPHKGHVDKLFVPVVAHGSSDTVIPSFTNYVSSKRNVLVEDDIHRTFLPYHGDNTWVEKDYADAETRIGRRKQKFNRFNELAELAHLYGSYAEDFLATVNTDFPHIVRYLLDETRSPAPSTLPRELLSLWLDRETHVQEDYYDDNSEESDSTPTMRDKKPLPRWQTVFKQISEPIESRKAAAACLACAAFKDATGFSLWHVAKRHHLVTNTLGGKFTNGNRPDTSISSNVAQANAEPEMGGLRSYGDLGCQVCFAHECPGHGEYEYDDEDSRKSIRFRVNTTRTSTLSKAKLGIDTNAKAFYEPIGIDDDGIIVGNSKNPADARDPGFSDSEVCSESCYWKRSNRLKTPSKWSESDNRLLQTLLPAYIFRKRGPCMIALAIRRPCYEIFIQICSLPAESIQKALSVRNQAMAFSSRTTSKRSADYWYNETITWKHDERLPFRPCNHNGPCSEANGCSCAKENVACEPSCMCAVNCTKRYRGCSCSSRGKACQDEKCDCYRLNRECSPDLCRSCGAGEVLDPVNRYRDDIIGNKCANVYLQRGVPRRTLLGDSKLLKSGGQPGWGLYMGEPVKKGEFLGEYVGEVVSNDEAETRGLIYNKRNLSYLFSLNRTQTLDSTRVGNKFRYINHQALPYANCYAKVLLCNSVHRIGLFAAKSLRIGEELLFDYGSEFTSRFDLIKLNDNAPPTIEKSRRGFVHKKSDPSIQGLAKKTGGRLGRRQKNISVEQSPNFRKGRAPKNDAVRKLVTIDDDIIEIVGGTIEDPKPKANPRKRKTIIEDEEDDNTSEVAGPSNAPIEAVSSSESYHESDEVEDDVLDEEPSIEEDGSSEPEHETPQKRGWRTRRANMGFGLDGAYETPQKRGWRTRKANSLLAQGKGKRRRRRWATNRTPKSASKSSPSVPASAGASGDKEGMPNAQKRGWVTRYANMEKRKAEQAMPRPQY